MKYIVSYSYIKYGDKLPTLGNQNYDTEDPDHALDLFLKWFSNRINTQFLRIAKNSFEIRSIEPYVDLDFTD